MSKNNAAAKANAQMKARSLEKTDTSIEDTLSSYEKHYDEVKMAIHNMGLIGIDVSSFKKSLKAIREDVDNDIGKLAKEKKNHVVYLKSAIYSTAIDRIKTLKTEILEQDAYFKVYNSCLGIQKEIAKGDITKGEISELVDEMIKNLIELSNNCGNIEKDKFLKIYNIVYELIKLEIIKTGDSRLCKNIAKKDDNKRYLNMVIENDLERLMSNFKVESKLLELKSKGVFGDYIDVDLIQSIIGLTDERFRARISEMLGAKMDTIIASDKALKELSDNITKIDDNVNSKIADMASKKKRTRKSAMALGMLLALIFTGGAIIEKLVRNHYMVPSYDVTKTTVSSDSNTRSVEHYPSYGKIDFVKTSEQKVYEDGHTETTTKEYEYVGNRLEKEQYSDNLVGFYILYIFVLSTIILINSVEDAGPFNLKKYGRMITSYKKIIDSKKEIAEQNEELKGLLSELEDEIEKDEKLRNTFYKLYKENKYLLYDQEELSRRFEELLKDKSEIKRAKTLRREFVTE